MPPACSSAARSPTASPPWAALSRPIGPTRLETTTSRRGAAVDAARGLLWTGARSAASLMTDSSAATSSPDIHRPRWPPLVETVARQPCSASDRRDAPPSGKPLQNRLNRGKLINCRRAPRSRPNPDRYAVAPVDLGEPVFVGRIVAEIHRYASLKRRLGHKSGDNPPLVMVPRLELDDHLAGDEPQRVPAFSQEPDGGVPNGRLGFGHGAVMHSECAALVFEQGARPSANQRLELRPQLFERFRRRLIGVAERGARVASVGLAAFDAVQSCRSAAVRPKQPVEFGDGPAADQRQGAVALRGAALKQVRE